MRGSSSAKIFSFSCIMHQLLALKTYVTKYRMYGESRIISD